MHRPGSCLERLTPANRARLPLRRRGVGRPRAPRARRLHRRAARPRRRGLLPAGPARRDARRLRRRPAPHHRPRGLLLHRRPLARRTSCATGSSPSTPARLADVLIGGLLISELDGPRSRGAQPPLARRRARRAELLRAAAAAQQRLHARLERVALRRRRAAAAVLARAPARGRERLGDLPLPPDVRGRRLLVLVSARGRRRAVHARGHRLTAPASRAATSCRSATRRCWWAWASARPAAWSSTSPARCSRPVLPSASSRAACSRTARTCTSTRCSASSIATP